MRLVTVGVAGSFPGPASPASAYLLQAHDGEREWNVLLDLGNGGLGALQRHVDPLDLDAVALSHLHPDHCADLSGLYVYLRYHPERGGTRTGVGRKLPVLGPAATPERAAAMYGLAPGESMAGEYDFQAWQHGTPVRVGPFELEPFAVFHPVEAYGIRVTGPSSVRPGERATLVYSGDTDACDGLVAGARDADLFLCEAAFQEGRDDAVERGIHLTGRRAGEAAAAAGARSLLLTHLPVWSSPDVARAEARSVYDGPVEVAVAGGVHEL
ncbi:MBL fold metallo-hydrolase [Krasilnikoviella flava]|uniref:Ribonuclease BN, tRNA processing enzyme n=1 Tax=Krasilnikoviella flava TaxID=526729 RepID=A0A1T5LPI2_9MICO|nr:MBL fold metallo-hydrolase [Krasilnikoviella flava]SKC77860.1 Ribonuclease BN, tRNA processing enzyme [Krasilnikoviella flava]